MDKMLSKIGGFSAGPKVKPFSEPINITHPYYKILDNITDYTKKINFEAPVRSSPIK